MNVLIATDGSEPALDAAHRSLTLLRDGARISLVMVIPDKEDPMATAGGFEGPVITEEEAEAAHRADEARAQSDLESTIAALGDDLLPILARFASPEAKREVLNQMVGANYRDAVSRGDKMEALVWLNALNYTAQVSP